jgi:hypothetical protein
MNDETEPYSLKNAYDNNNLCEDYEADFYSTKNDLKYRNGKTLRNRFWRLSMPDEDRIIFVEREEPDLITKFDIDFDILFYKPLKNHYYNTICTNVFDNNGFEKVIEYLDNNNINKKKDKTFTTYSLPVIGKFDKYDSHKNEYIYFLNNEDNILYSNSKKYVTYKMYNRVTSKYFIEKNNCKKTKKNAKEPRCFFFYKYGRKYVSSYKKNNLLKNINLLV